MHTCSKCEHTLHETDSACPQCGAAAGTQNPFVSNITVTNNVETTSNASNDAHLPQAWQNVFSYIDKAGGATLPNIKSLTNKEQQKININFYAFFFGFIYMLIKGMWRPAITRTVALVCTSIVLEIILTIILDRPIPQAGFVGLGIISAYRINVTYYRMQRLNEKPWW